MFTGLVEAVGEVVGAETLSGGGRRIAVAHRLLGETLALGESVAVDGACLTVTAVEEASVSHAGRFEAELSPETLERTTLGHLSSGVRVNLERALRLGDRLGGHLVAGHVDGVARVVDVTTQAEMTEVVIEAPAALGPLIAEKGSVTLSGVSLTVNRVSVDRLGAALFTVQLIPHTRAETTLGALERGDELNLEVDLIARYVQRLTTAGRA